MKNYIKIVYPLLIAVLLQSCGEASKEEQDSKPEAPKEEPVVEVSVEVELPTFDVQDTALIVNNSSVIFLYPDSTEYAKMEEEYSEDDLAEVLSGMHWYPMLVQDELDSTDIMYTDCMLPHIVFNKADGSSTIIKKKQVEGNMILFNINNEPIVTYAVSFDKKNHMEYLNKN